jgi:hypothetical protein
MVTSTDGAGLPEHEASVSMSSLLKLRWKGSLAGRFNKNAA